MDLITAAEFERKMKDIATSKGKTMSDVSTRHEKADALLCEVLKSMGYDAGVKIFEDMVKWYA